MSVTESNGTVATGGVAVTVLQVNNQRTQLAYGNNSSAVMNFSATQGQVASATIGVPVSPGGSFVLGSAISPPPTGPVTVYSAVTGAAFYIAETSNGTALPYIPAPTPDAHGNSQIVILSDPGDVHLPAGMSYPVQHYEPLDTVIIPAAQALLYVRLGLAKFS